VDRRRRVRWSRHLHPGRRRCDGLLGVDGVKDLLIEIPIRAVAKQRARTVNGHTYTPPRTREFETSVALYSISSTRFLEGELRVDLTISSTKKLRGDIDNYEKAILDGLVKSRTIGDDKQIREKHTVLVDEGEVDAIWIRIRERATITLEVES
jgi:Holliday junction resolvase RusA-like endonuclease